MKCNINIEMPDGNFICDAEWQDKLIIILRSLADDIRCDIIYKKRPFKRKPIYDHHAQRLAKIGQIKITK